MSYNKLLTFLKANPAVTITAILSQPRTLSNTVLGAMSQFSQGLMSEPCYPPNTRDFDHVCERILNFTKARIEENPHTQTNITLKEMLHVIQPNDFERLMLLTDNIIFMVREPTLHARSCINAFSRDNGGDTQLAEDGYINMSAPNYKRYLSYIETARVKHPENIIIIDASDVQKDPINMLNLIAKQFNWPQNATNEWEPLINRYGYVYAEIPDEIDWRSEMTNNHWAQSAFLSSHIRLFDPQKDTALPPNSFSPKVEAFLSETAYPVYNEVLEMRTSSQLLNTLLYQEIEFGGVDKH